MQEFGFPRLLRLLTPEDFQFVFNKTRYKVYSPGFLLLATPSQQSNPRIGFVIGKRHIKLAVARNRVKRMYRESFRLRQHQLPHLDIIILAIKGASQVTAEDLSKNMTQAWLQLDRRVNKATSNLSSSIKRQ